METQAVNILAVGRNAAIMEVVHRLINTHENWTGVAVTTDEEAVALLRQTPFDLVLLCGGILAEEEYRLKQKMLLITPSLLFVQHYGGGSGLLENEILAALSSR